VGKTKGKIAKPIMEILQKYIIKCKAVRFTGDNYSEEWEIEAKKRGLTNYKCSLDAFETFIKPKTIKAFKGILSEQELRARYEIATQQYNSNIEIEANLIIELFRTNILPPALKTLKDQTDALGDSSISKRLKELTLKAIDEVDLLEKKKSKEQCEKAREVIDLLEGFVDDSYWSLPKYRELLWLV
jgi:Uncharacterized protein related to glutamine synthetase